MAVSVTRAIIKQNKKNTELLCPINSVTTTTTILDKHGNYVLRYQSKSKGNVLQFRRLRKFSTAQPSVLFTTTMSLNMQAT